MPAALDVTGPQRLLSTIYRQSWPPPAKTGKKTKSREHLSEKQAIAGSLWNGGATFKPNTGPKITRPFSANLVSPRRGKRGRLMNNRRSNSRLSVGSDAAPRRSPLKPKVPEYDQNKVSHSAASRVDKSLAAEYMAMLSGKNTLKKQYREQYWVSARPDYKRPTSARSYVPPKMLYPDLGSVIGDTRPRYIAGTALGRQVASHGRSSAVWRIPSTSSTEACNEDAESQQEAAVADESLTGGNRNRWDPEKRTQQEFTYTLKRSWSNIPTGKCYRVLSHPNDTLASLCLEGKSSIFRNTKSRTSSTSSTNSVSSFLPRSRSLSSAGDSSPSTSSDTVAGSLRSRSFVIDKTPTTQPQHERDRKDDVQSDLLDGGSGVHGLPDSVFDDEEEVNDENIRCCETDYEEEDDDEEDEVEEDGDPGTEEEDGCKDVALIETADVRLPYSDLEESDISENEADDYDERDVDQEEVSRRLQQVSAVFDTSKDVDEISVDPDNIGQLAITDGKNLDSDCEDVAALEELWSDDNATSSDSKESYSYAEVLPHPFNKCDLRTFAALPSDVDWRDFVELPSFLKRAKLASRQHSNRRKSDDHKGRKAKDNMLKKYKSFEETVDRLIMLEKMQALTVQYEQDRRRHLMHRAKSRSASAKSSSNANSNAATQKPSSNTPSPPPASDPRPQSAKPSPRKNASSPPTPPVLSRPRKSASGAELRIDGLGEKNAQELDLVRLSCTKNHLQYRRSSFSLKKRQRTTRSALPRYYEYTWSERLPESKRPSLSSMCYTKTRTCASCRERERKLTQLHITQMMLGRPRSSFSTFSSSQQKLHPRPSTTASLTSGARSTPRLSKDNAGVEKSPDPSPPKTAPTARSDSVQYGATFGRPATASPNAATKEKIAAARAILSSVARDYARAARCRYSRSNSAPMQSAGRPASKSPTNGGRNKKAFQVLKPHVVDYTKLRLR